MHVLSEAKAEMQQSATGMLSLRAHESAMRLLGSYASTHTRGLQCSSDETDRAGVKVKWGFWRRNESTHPVSHAWIGGDASGYTGTARGIHAATGQSVAGYPK